MELCLHLLTMDARVQPSFGKLFSWKALPSLPQDGDLRKVSGKELASGESGGKIAQHTDWKLHPGKISGGAEASRGEKIPPQTARSLVLLFL